ncbi:MAG: zf-TFIIB domain-containing protein [Planctomycetes bacterium]|nr:zf-TFIIB domain-containing protein [Planctomycetota bacterium]
MKCPKCGKTLRKFELMESVSLDICTACKGIWYDKGELAFQQEVERDIPDLKTVQKTSFPTKCDCPRCADGSKLEEMKYHVKHDLLVDRCVKCHGLWLDFKELDKLEKVVARTESFTQRLARAMKDIDARGFTVVARKKIKE